MILRCEMPIEAPVREPGGLHEIGQSGRGDPVLAEFSRGGRHDPLPCLRGFDSRLPHLFASPQRGSRPKSADAPWHLIGPTYTLDVDRNLKELWRRSRMSQGTVLVTGATGDTGRATVDELLARGHKVRALAHGQDDRSKRLQERGVEVVYGDLLDFGQVRAAL